VCLERDFSSLLGRLERGNNQGLKKVPLIPETQKDDSFILFDKYPDSYRDEIGEFL
jgi:hypothetical protein